MLIYSHLVVASILEPYIKPRKIEEYYLGSIAPDIRYFAAIPRTQTHIAIDQIIKFAEQYPHLSSFVLGYLVHCASENLPVETGLREAVLGQFPFSWSAVQQKIPKNFVSILLAFYHLENYHPTIHISENGNEMLRQLGIHDETVHVFTRRFNRFLNEPSLITGMSALSDLGLLGNAGVKTYLQVVNIIKINFLKRWLFSLMKEAATNFPQKSISILLPFCELLPVNRDIEPKRPQLISAEGQKR